MKHWTRGDYATIALLALARVVALVFVVSTVRMMLEGSRMAQLESRITLECLEKGYTEARVYHSANKAFCVGMRGGDTVVTLLEDLRRE